MPTPKKMTLPMIVPMIAIHPDRLRPTYAPTAPIATEALNRVASRVLDK